MNDGGYPIMMKIKSAHCIVIGAGQVAVRKISSLLDVSARVTVISPTAVKEIEDWHEEGKINLVRREYDGAGDLRGGALVFAATNRDEVNASVYRDAVILGIPVNDVSKPMRSTFYLPSIMRRGKLVMAVSTSGASPGLANKLRDELEQRIGAEYEIYVDFLSELRELILSKVKDAELRKCIFQNVLKFDILEVIRSGHFESYRNRVLKELLELDNMQEWEAIVKPNS